MTAEPEKTTLLLVRHGRAETAGGKPDAERLLTEEGVAELRASCAGVRALGLRLDAIVSSPLLRAAATAQILGAELGCKLEPQADAGLAPGALVDAVLAALRGVERARTIAVVGHAPDLTGITAALVVPGRPRAFGFAPGGMACLAFAGAVRRGAGTLVWARSPQDLAVLGPDA